MDMDLFHSWEIFFSFPSSLYSRSFVLISKELSFASSYGREAWEDAHENTAVR